MFHIYFYEVCCCIRMTKICGEMIIGKAFTLVGRLHAHARDYCPMHQKFVENLDLPSGIAFILVVLTISISPHEPAVAASQSVILPLKPLHLRLNACCNIQN